MTMRSRTAATLMLVAFALTTSPPALGAPGDPATTPGKTTDDADALFRKGSVAYDAGKVEPAYQLYLAAWRLKQTHDIAGNLAQVELALGKKRDAAEHIAFALAHFPPTVTAQHDRREKMTKVLDGLRQEIATVRLRVNVADAEVLLDDKAIGKSPIDDEVFVEAGSHVARARLAGYVDARQALETPKGSTQTMTLSLSPVPPPPPREDGPPAASAWRPPVGLLVATGVLAAGGLLVGGALAATANGKASNASALDVTLGSGSSVCTTPAASTAASCSALHDAVAGKGTFSNAALGGFVGGGVFALATVGLGVWAAGSPKAAPVRVAPIVGAGTGGLLIGGTW